MLPRPGNACIRMSVPSSLRLWVLLAATIAWCWANSVFSPWAVDRAPRLWLYDLLFYLRFALLAWAAAEVLRIALRRAPPRRAEISPLALIALAVLAAQVYQHGEAGLRWKLAASNDALLAVAGAGNSDQRRRAGHFLIDSVRTPCGPATWLWLGRPFGGGTGINLALVHAGERVPATPFPDAFAFWYAHADWWLAYQHGGRYERAVQRQPSQVAACSAGSVLSRHRQGRAFIASG
jgi:hypothetical protein